jgi:hypothetical protein
VKITYAVAVTAIAGDLFTTEAVAGFRGWQAAAATLQAVWEKSTARRSRVTPIHSALARAAAASRYAHAASPAGSGQSYAGPEQAMAVICSDSPNPRQPAVYRALAAFAFARSGDIGPSVAWGDEPCSTWPVTATDRYTGPWNRPTSSPILVIGNTLDPSTPYQDSVAMTRRLARARLLTVDGYGHTALLNQSTCAENYESNYLVNGKLPPTGTVCQQNQRPFTLPPGRG